MPNCLKHCLGEHDERVVIVEQKQTVEEVLAERKGTHGDFTDHARVTQSLVRAGQDSPNYDTLPDIIKETFHMDMHKWGRILTGNPYVHDHYIDQNGYNQLIIDRTIDKVGLKPDVTLRSITPFAPAMSASDSAQAAANSAARAESALESVKKIADAVSDMKKILAKTKR